MLKYIAHKTVEMNEIPIDVMMVPTIRAMWDAGVQTYYVCESSFLDHRTIMFDTRADLNKALSMVQNHKVSYISTADQFEISYDGELELGEPNDELQVKGESGIIDIVDGKITSEELYTERENPMCGRNLHIARWTLMDEVRAFDVRANTKQLKDAVKANDMEAYKVAMTELQDYRDKKAVYDRLKHQEC